MLYGEMCICHTSHYSDRKLLYMYMYYKLLLGITPVCVCVGGGGGCTMKCVCIIPENRATTVRINKSETVV